MTVRATTLVEPTIVDIPDGKYTPGDPVTAYGTAMRFVARRRNTRTGVEWFDLAEIEDGRQSKLRSARPENVRSKKGR